jgi:hypothetical protein
LLDLGEAVGTQSRGLSQEHISLLPVTKYKCGFFSRKKTRRERSVYNLLFHAPVFMLKKIWCSCQKKKQNHAATVYIWHNIKIFAYRSGSDYALVCNNFVRFLNGRGVNSHDFPLVDRCVICQMEYRRGNLQMTLPCKHVYHASCVTRWLSINKVSNQEIAPEFLVFISSQTSFGWGKYIKHISFAGLPCLLCWSSWRGTQEAMSYRSCGLH